MKILGFDLEVRNVAFFMLFTVLSLMLSTFNVAKIVGVENQAFTAFQFIGPIGGGILGPFGGAASVFAIQIINFILGGKALDLVTFVRLFPMVFAAIYFGAKKKQTSSLIAIACMLAFWANPIGQQAWYYALYWLIPLGASFFPQNLFARSLGATFTAHAIGSVAFLYGVTTMPASAWLALIPVVALERLVFASGICVSYVAVTSILSMFATKIDLSFLNIEKQYSLVKAA